MSGTKNPLVQRLTRLIDEKYDVVSKEFEKEIRGVKPKQRAQVDTDVWNGPSLLTTVAKKSLYNHMKYLLNCEVPFDVNRVDGNGRSALQSCRKVECVELLLAADADPNIRSDSMTTPLQEFSSCDLVDCAEKVIAAGADVNAHNNSRLSALHEARSAQMVQLLIQSGAIIDISGPNDETPLIRACSWNRSPDIIEALLQGGADLFAVDRFGTDALCTVCEKFSIGQAMAVDRLTAYALILAGAPLDACRQTSKHWKVPLECAKEKPHMLRLMLIAGAKPDAEAIETIENFYSGAELSMKIDVFLPFVLLHSSILKLLRDPELTVACQDEKLINRQKILLETQREEWHQVIWTKCHQRVTELAMIFISFPTLVIAEICFNDQVYLTQLKYHLIVDRIESVKRTKG